MLNCQSSYVHLPHIGSEMELDMVPSTVMRYIAFDGINAFTDRISQVIFDCGFNLLVISYTIFIDLMNSLTNTSFAIVCL